MAVKVNVSSILLTESENNHIFGLIGSKALTVSTAVVKYYKTNPPIHKEWIEVATGVLMLVRDAARRSYYVRFCSFDGVDFEQEVYRKMTINGETGQFLSFEAHDFIVGFLFSNYQEFEQYFALMADKISVRKPGVAKTAEPLKKKIGNQESSTSIVSLTKKEKKKKSATFKKKMTFKKKKEKEPAPTLSIGTPQDFRTVTHIGNDSSSGLENLADASKWKEVSQYICGTTDLTPDVLNHLVDYVSKNGGIERFYNAVHKKKDKKGNNDYDAQLVNNAINNLPQSKTSAPPVPPPMPKGGPPQAPQIPNSSLPRGPPPTINKNIPPPPGKPANFAPNPPVPLSQNASSSVEETPRGGLLDQIQKGRTLKKTERSEKPEQEEDDEGLLGALSHNLANFRAKMNVCDDSDDSEEEVSDWD